MSWKQYLSLGVTTALGAAAGYATSHLGEAIPSTATQWKALGIGAGIAAVSALAHLWQQAPGKAS